MQDRPTSSHLNPIFQNYPLQVLVKSILHDYRGMVLEEGDAILLILGDFIFISGNPETWEPLVQHFSRRSSNIIFPWDTDFSTLLPKLSNNYRIIQRYSFPEQIPEVNEEGINPQLEKLKIVPILTNHYDSIRKLEWARDVLGYFDGSEDFGTNGKSFMLFHDKTPVAGIGAYMRYHKSIEVEIDTHPAWRRKGLAAYLGAFFLNFCKQNELFPHWDAHNNASKALAEKLGFKGPRSYKVLAPA
jgi:GNAT superfamily N-acetyltransferase